MRLMENILSRENMMTAYRRVVANKGAPGVDKMTVAQLQPYLATHWPRIKEELLNDRYRPAPVRGVEIPKPGGKGMRLLGIPTVLDRLIQQAIHQVLMPIFDPGFSNSSFGFRPKRSAHDAVRAAQTYVAAGKRIVVDLDLEKFFDRVNHDVLMARVARKVKDKQVLRLIRRYLQAGLMTGGLVTARSEGTPQGGPLSPTLSNILLDDLDKELERRGHAFCRYADDCNIYVQSWSAGKRVMTSITRFLTERLRLTVNVAKSAVDRPWNRRFLGFTFRDRGARTRRRVSPRAVEKAKDRIRELTNRNRGASMTTVVKELTLYLRGWKQYFGLCEVPSPRRDLDVWIRARLRLLQVKQWIRGTTAYRRLVAAGVPVRAANHTAKNLRRWWHAAHSPGMHHAMPTSYFDQLGLPRPAP